MVKIPVSRAHKGRQAGIFSGKLQKKNISPTHKERPENKDFPF